ncbi:diguanylate cyclase [Virgibacillus sp. L01]|uniref:diguanylate cyclase n=1 Tax=Virgibacillus sp. L01 TaxID=3457429 RepID=UPI003FD1CC6F
MTYKAKTQYVSGTILFLMALTFIAFNIYYLFFLLLIFLLNFMSSQLTIDDEKITYKTYIFAVPIYKKEVAPVRITELKLKRVSWAKKCAVIKVIKGLNIRVINFHPETIYQDLIRYAKDNDVKVIKTKDYKILEKMH